MQFNFSAVYLKRFFFSWYIFSVAHGFLPKAPIKREKVNETLAPLWLKRFPPSEFGESVGYDTANESNSVSGDVASSPYDIAQKLVDIDNLFKKNAPVLNLNTIHEQMHELKGDLLTLNSDVSTISIIGMINLIMSAQSKESIAERWSDLRVRIDGIINIQNCPQADDRRSNLLSAQKSARRMLRMNTTKDSPRVSFTTNKDITLSSTPRSDTPLTSSFNSTASSKT